MTLEVVFVQLHYVVSLASLTYRQPAQQHYYGQNDRKTPHCESDFLLLLPPPSISVYWPVIYLNIYAGVAQR